MSRVLLLVLLVVSALIALAAVAILAIGLYFFPLYRVTSATGGPIEVVSPMQTVAPTVAFKATSTALQTPESSMLTKVPLKAADSDAPASGICASSDGDIVEATLTADGPSMPRCVKVTAAQRLKIINGTSAPVRIMLGHFDVEIPAGGQAVLDEPVGEYLAPGVHLMVNGPEVWLSQP